MHLDIFIKIGAFLSIKNLLKIEMLSKKYQALVRNTAWMHKIKLRDSSKIRLLLNNYNFQIFYLLLSDVRDYDLKLLANKHTVILYMCSFISDAGIKYLANCKIVDISYNKQLTDAGIIHLEKCEYLNVQGCDVSESLIFNLRKTVKYLIRKSSV